MTCIREACGASPNWEPPDQVRYLFSYLNHGEAAAKTIIVEKPYTDRHYLAEYQGYYSTAFRPPGSRTTRLHFLQEELTASLVAEISEAGTDAGTFRELRRKLQDLYLGFSVIRPLQSAPVGRTVLRPYHGKVSRRFGPPLPPHRAHLLGLTLKARGVQFHQQDRAVGACATAAIASALAAVTRRDGGRAPTALAITEHANKSTPEGRIFPAVAGLSRQQMIGAMLACGYSPDVAKPALDDPALLLLAITTYIRSGIPVVMQIGWAGATDEQHAVTIVGFRESDDEEPAADIVGAEVGSYRLRARGVSKLYVHDDRLGPYARMKWTLEGSLPLVTFIPYGERFPDLERPAMVSCVLVPLYPKIRTSAADVLLLAGQVLPVAVQLVGGANRDEVFVETAFRLAGDYVEEVLRLPIGRGRVAVLISTLALSRYVAVIRFSLSGTWIMDVVCDATDIRRDVQKWSQVLAVIPASEDALVPLQPYFKERCPEAVVA